MIVENSQEIFGYGTPSVSQQIFSARKTGDFHTAYSLSQNLLSNEKLSEWETRAVGWTLNDVSKKDGYSKEQVVNEAKRLISIGDFKENDSGLISCLNLIVEKNENPETLVKKYREELKNKPEDPSLQERLGWSLYRLSKKSLEKEQKYKAVKLLQEFAQLTKIQRPSLLISLMFNQALTLAKEKNYKEFSFIRFCQWVGVDCFRSEDYQPTEIETERGQQTLPSLHQKVFRRIGNELHENYSYLDARQKKEAKAWLEYAIQKYPNDVWFVYYLGKFQFLEDDLENARVLISKVVREKPTEGWAWSFLGQIFSKTDPQMEKSCYCKALISSNDLEKTLPVRARLLPLLLKEEQYQQACLEISIAMKVGKKFGIKIDPKFQKYRGASWYKDAGENPSNLNFYLENALSAEDFVYQDCPQSRAVVGRAFQNKKGKLKIEIHLEGSRTIPVSEKMLKVLHLHEGQPITVRTLKGLNGRENVVLIRPRVGKDWDVFPKPERHASMNFEKEQGKSKEFEHEIIKVVTTNGYAFTDTGIFIPASLVEKLHLKANDMVNITAVESFDTKKNKMGWKAIRIIAVT